jgi:ADP-heptose:LPS heptosyltransferase/GT2 family glycosyltransferase
VSAPVLFGDYDLLARSGLFDPDYYLKSNPDVAALNVDPLLHYMEQGCLRRLDPSAAFDTAHYLKLCEKLGDAPVNALAHYLTVGIGRGLTPSPRTALAPLLCVDIPRIVSGAAESPVRGGLTVVGWGLAAGGASTVEIALDGVRVTTARAGLRRPDVAAAHPERPESLLSGYAAHLPAKALPLGPHRVTVTLRDHAGQEAAVEFAIDVQAVPGDFGPSALRSVMPQAEVDYKLATLERLQWQPTFRVVMPLALHPHAIAAARRTLESLGRQSYAKWQVWLVPTGVVADAGSVPKRGAIGRKRARAAAGPTALDALREEFADIAAHIEVLGVAAAAATASAASAPCFVARMLPGDLAGCDAWLEFALASALEPRTDLCYCDERRRGLDGAIEAYFKPGWSPDLALSTPYLGRAWVADSRVLERAGLGLADLCERGDHDLVLRLSEAARRIEHVPHLLMEQGGAVAAGGGAAAAGERAERQAVAEALRRRGIDATVQPGLVPGHYRILRTVTPARVSIIIPTCAAGGLIKVCIETLRSLTAYRDYEILCIENIPAADRSWKRWLKGAADRVIVTREPFNWSRYNNLAAARASGTHLLFLNDDMEVIDPGWLAALVEQAQRPEVGVTGALLLYPDRSVQQAGVMLDDAGRGRHAFRHLPEGDPGYFGLALTQRNVLSVTGACLMTRRDTFESLGGFDESHAVINNDLDFCLRAWSRGLLNVYTPYARLIHHELGSRAHLEEDYDAGKFRQRWRAVIAQGDPYFNPHLAHGGEQFAVETEPVETVYAGQPLIARDAVRRILVVKLDHIGDCITALPALRRVKGHFPDARITVLCGRATRSIWEAEGRDEVIEYEFFNPRSSSGRVPVTARERQDLERRLRARRFDLAIDLRKQPDTREVLALTGARVLVGFDHQGRFPWLNVALEWDEDVPLRGKHGHVADDLVALIDTLAARCEAARGVLLPAPAGALSLPGGTLKRLFSKPVICVHPASGSPMRQWPLAKFAALIELLLDGGDHHVAVIGGADEKALVQPLFAALTRRAPVFNLVGQLGLEELPRLLARAVLFVGNNSGPQHLAGALGVPTVGIHSGVVDAAEWAPLGPRAVALQRAMSCSPCFLERPQDCSRGLACLTELAVRDVYAACRRALAGSG